MRPNEKDPITSRMPCICSAGVATSDNWTNPLSVVDNAHICAQITGVKILQSGDVADAWAIPSGIVLLRESRSTDAQYVFCKGGDFTDAMD